MTIVILLVLLNLNIIPFGLGIFVGKNLIKLCIEGKQKILGYKFKTKIVVIFVVLTSSTCSASVLYGKRACYRLHRQISDPQFRQPLTSSLNVAKAVYEMERQRAMEFAREGVSGEKSASGYRTVRMNRSPENPTETIKAAFDGKRGTEVISGENGDYHKDRRSGTFHGKLTGIMS